MSKFKNCNITLSIIFSAVALISALCNIFYVADRYPLSANSFFLFSSALLIFLSALMLLLGIFASGKKFISVSSILLCLQSFLYAVYYLYASSYSGLYYYTPNILAEFLHFIMLLLPAAAYLLLALYSFNIIKSTKIIFPALFIAWIVLLLTSGRITAELLILSSLILLTKYADIKNPAVKVKMGEVFVLSVVTFSIYYVLWSIFSAIKTERFLDKKATLSELWLFSLFFPYSAYWYYTRYEELGEKDYGIKNRGTVCMVLSLVLLFPMALCILQRDLNKLSESLPSENKEPIKEESSEINPEAESSGELHKDFFVPEMSTEATKEPSEEE